MYAYIYIWVYKYAYINSRKYNTDPPPNTLTTPCVRCRAPGPGVDPMVSIPCRQSATSYTISSKSKTSHYPISLCIWGKAAIYPWDKYCPHTSPNPRKHENTKPTDSAYYHKRLTIIQDYIYIYIYFTYLYIYIYIKYFTLPSQLKYWELAEHHHL